MIGDGGSSAEIGMLQQADAGADVPAAGGDGFLLT